MFIYLFRLNGHLNGLYPKPIRPLFRCARSRKDARSPLLTGHWIRLLDWHLLMPTIATAPGFSRAGFILKSIYAPWRLLDVAWASGPWRPSPVVRPIYHLGFLHLHRLPASEPLLTGRWSRDGPVPHVLLSYMWTRVSAGAPVALSLRPRRPPRNE